MEDIKNNKYIDFYFLLEKDKISEAEVIVTDNKKIKRKAKDPPTLSFYEWVSAWNVFLAISTKQSPDPDLASKMCKHMKLHCEHYR